ncbi:uncharacterized protein N7469_011281 [Penicillium citrinum]|uniref:Uncharacterized protein n=1 Tax=Penicillium citrinum TaxID=5077 RepID=A0A9W9TCN3_PENCI|nr:uncharacterized protein N7469_011281 [Penicillium citrinum]KAJ5217656.1 hypothetical protein N7469_011281 [Penicillium citrinum]
MTPKVRKTRTKRSAETEISQESSGNIATFVGNNNVSQDILEYTHTSFAAVGNETAFQEYDPKGKEAEESLRVT